MFQISHLRPYGLPYERYDAGDSNVTNEFIDERFSIYGIEKLLDVGLKDPI
jgi:hypothetical protein